MTNESDRTGGLRLVFRPGIGWFVVDPRDGMAVDIDGNRFAMPDGPMSDEERRRGLGRCYWLMRPLVREAREEIAEKLAKEVRT